jgi:hypothetical protein
MIVPLRALMVEDSENDAALLGRELRRGGYEVALQRVDSSDAMSTAIERERGGIWLSATIPCLTSQGRRTETVIACRSSGVPPWSRCIS